MANMAELGSGIAPTANWNWLGESAATSIRTSSIMATDQSVIPPPNMPNSSAAVGAIISDGSPPKFQDSKRKLLLREDAADAVLKQWRARDLWLDTKKRTENQIMESGSDCSPRREQGRFGLAPACAAGFDPCKMNVQTDLI
jgi:hypothetical protein